MSRFIKRPARGSRPMAVFVFAATAFAFVSSQWLTATPSHAAKPKVVQGGANEPPTISGCFATPNSLPAQGGIATVICHVTDDGTIDSVSVQATGSNGQLLGTSLVHTTGDSYEAQLLFPENPSLDPISYGLEWFALDTEGGSSATSIIVEVVVEGQPQFDEFPVISDVQLDPARHSAAGGTTTISAMVTDDRAVGEARALVFPPGGGPEVEVVLKSNGARFAGVFPVPANTSNEQVEYTVLILATDDIGQEAQAAGGEITVDPDADDPVLSKATVTPRKLKPSGKGLSVSVNATDESEIVSVVARFLRGEHVLEVELVKASKGNTYEASYALPRNRSRKTQVYRVEFVALDAIGNSATLDAGTVKVKAGGLIPGVPRPRK